MEQVSTETESSSSVEVQPTESVQEGMDQHVVSAEGEGRELFSSEGAKSPSNLADMDLEDIKALRKKYEEEGDDYDPELEEEIQEGDLQESSEISNTQDEVVENAELPQEPQALPNDSDEQAQLKQLVEATDRRIVGIEEQYNQTIATINHLQAKAEELGSDNPSETARIVYQLEGLNSQVQQLQQDYTALQNYKQNMQIVPKYIPMKYFFKDEIVESFMEDGWSKERAVNYVQNMFATESPTTIIALAKNAIHRVHTKQLLAQQNQQASGQRKPQTNNKPVRRDADDVAEMINRAKKIPKTLSPSPMSTVSMSESVSENDLAELPLAEIKRRLREELKKDGKV